MGLFSPKWQHKNIEKRIEWIVNADIMNLNNIEVIFQIAINDIDLRVKDSALNKIANNVDKISDIKPLIDLLHSFSHERKQEETIKKIIAHIIKVIKPDLVGTIKNEQILIEITNKSLNEKTKQMAINNINNQDFLLELAHHGKEPFIRKAAVLKIKDKDILFKIAKTDNDDTVISAAVNKLSFKKIDVSDQKALFLFAMHSNSSDIDAIFKISDQKLLIDLANNHNSTWCRQAAVKRITNFEILNQIANNNSDTSARQSVVENKILTQENIIYLAKNCKCPFVRKDAVKKIFDKTIVADIAIFDEDAFVREIAVKGISDLNKLDQIADHDIDKEVREEAIQRKVEIAKKNEFIVIVSTR